MIVKFADRCRGRWGYTPKRNNCGGLLDNTRKWNCKWSSYCRKCSNNKINKEKNKMKRYEVQRFYYDNHMYPQHSVVDTKRNDTVRNYMGFTQIITLADAKWLCRELNQINERKNKGNDKK